MPKKVVWQRNMSAMEVRGDFLEADGTELKARSLRSARNLRALATGGVETRPGLLFMRDVAGARQAVEITPADGVTFLFLIYDRRFQVVLEDGTQVHDVTDAPWADGAQVWVLPQRQRTLIGDPATGLYVLEYREGAWEFGPFGFGSGVGSSRLQPYWNFNRGVTLRTSGVTGTVTLEASRSVFRQKHVGLRVRYLGREVMITSVASGTAATGNVISKLPPSFLLTVTSTSNMRVDEVVEQSTSGFQGIITKIVSSTTVDVATLENLAGPDVGADETLVFPSGTTTITGKSAIDPQPVKVWDEPLMSDLRGWPRTAATAGGRLVLADFPQAPSVVAISAAGALDDFEVGVEDDDAILRSLEGAARIRHVIDAGDLIILADRGSYVVSTRDGTGITPRTFSAFLFDERGANAVRPIYTRDAVIFVDSGGRNLVAAVLDNSGALRWTSRFLSTFHADIIRSPIALCGPAASSEAPEKYAFVVNADGTLAVISWLEGLGDEGVGFAPWDTRGAITHIAAAFGSHVLIVNRATLRGPRTFAERFEAGLHLDCAARGLPDQPGLASHLAGMEVAVCWNDRDNGDGVVEQDGRVLGFDHIDTPAQVGLNFVAEASPWPVEVIESPRVGTFTARVIRFLVSTRNSGPFKMRCNNDTRSLGGYRFGDVLGEPAPLMTDVARAPVLGRRTHPDLAVVRDRPGPFKVLALGQEVQA